MIDYELIADVKNGLDVMEELQINEKAILVTSCFEDGVIRERCEKLGVEMIPKSYVPVISINCQDSTRTSITLNIEKSESILTKPAIITQDTGKNVDLILLDDNSTLTDAWVLQGEEVGKQVKAYNNILIFQSEIMFYKKDTPIYIDSDLGSNLSGQDLAKELYDQGFINLYLCTGFPANHFNEMYWIKEILGKEAPF